MQIRDFDNSQKDYKAYAHIMNSVWREPVYTIDDLRQWDVERPAKLVHQRFLAELEGQVVGFGSFEQEERFYHPQHFWMNLDVLPDYRQQGVGSQLYDHMLSLLQSDYAAKELHTLTTESRSHSLRFLDKRGFVVDKRDPKSRLDLEAFDWTPFQGLDAKIAAAGIQIKALSDLMAADANALYKVYELHQRLVSNVPTPAEHTRVEFESWLDGYSSSNPYFIPEANFMALDGSDYIGLSSLWGLLSAPETLYNGMTGVLPAYRRQGIATALKLRLVAFGQAQGTERIMTSNNSENPMYQLNLKLGFRSYDKEIKLVKRIADSTQDES